jgi:hypothetical protein
LFFFRDAASVAGVLGVGPRRPAMGGKSVVTLFFQEPRKTCNVSQSGATG